MNNNRNKLNIIYLHAAAQAACQSTDHNYSSRSALQKIQHTIRVQTTELPHEMFPDNALHPLQVENALDHSRNRYSDTSNDTSHSRVVSHAQYTQIRKVSTQDSAVPTIRVKFDCHCSPVRTAPTMRPALTRRYKRYNTKL